MAVIADPLCSLPSLCQRLSEQNVCMDEGVHFSLPCISMFMLSSVEQRLYICTPSATDAEYEHLYQKHCIVEYGGQVMDCVCYSACFPS